MGKVAHRRSDKIVLPVIYDNRKSAQRRYQLLILLNPRRVCTRSGSDHIVGVLKKMRLGIRKTGFLRAGHGMPAYKASVQPHAGGGLMNFCLNASHIRQNTGGRSAVLQLLQRSNIRAYRGAEKHVSAFLKF